MTDQGIGATPKLNDTVTERLGTPPQSLPGASNDRGTVVGLGPSKTLTDTQRMIALMLLWIMIGIIGIITIFSLGYTVLCSANFVTCTQASDSLDVLTKNMSPIFSAIIGLVGSVVGFYFGSKQT